MAAVRTVHAAPADASVPDAVGGRSGWSLELTPPLVPAYWPSIRARWSTAAYLPYDLRPSSIREAYETNCLTRYPADRYRVVTISKEEGDSTRETIAHFVNHAGFDFLVVGMVGRKGPKLDPTILGSAADYSLRSAHCSSVIIKKPVSGPARFLVGVDGSERSHKTAEMIVNLAEAEDEVVIIHVNDDDAEDGLDTKYKGPAIKKRYQEFCASVEGVKCSYAEAEAPRAVTVAQVLSDYALDEDFTYLAIGADGMGAYVNGRAIFGSNSDRIVKICKVNVIVTQDRKEALG